MGVHFQVLETNDPEFVFLSSSLSRSGLMGEASYPLPVCSSLDVCSSFVTVSVCHPSIQSPVHPTSTLRCLLWIKSHIKYQDTGTSLLPEANGATHCRASSEASREGVTQGCRPLRLLLAVCEFSDLSFHLAVVREPVSSFS